jgi:hypothetical protein
MSVSSTIDPTGKQLGGARLPSITTSAETLMGGGSAGGKIGGALHGGGMSDGSNITVPEDALGVTAVNFTTVL